jgi:hypothetical protein
MRKEEWVGQSKNSQQYSVMIRYYTVLYGIHRYTRYKKSMT